MNLNALKKFAQAARRKLMSEVSTRLDYLLTHDDAYVRAHDMDLKEIRRQLAAKGRERFVEEAAYTWFNRLVAFRYMDLRGYTKVRIVSPQAGQVQPELLFQIKQGRTPKELEPLQRVFDGYLGGTVQSDQPDREIYTAALLGMCNDYSRTLPFLFRKVDEYMAVLLPTDVLSESSILSAVQGAITEDDVADVEIIGWLYQFYISEKKDQVFGRPKGEKIKKEDIPAATQLFTPHWIVRYMVENSLGRLWRNNRPDTGLKERMEYYIEGDPEPEFLKIDGPEEITLLDPACGSGHILTFAFDLLYGMYEETGYSAEEIPSLILTSNLYGIDIDTRAAELAAFALTMKAREKDRFFFQRGVVPNVLAMEDVEVDLREAGVTMSPQLQEAFGYLSEATNFGSLIPVPAEVQGEIEELLAGLEDTGDADLFADDAMARVRSGLRQLGYLARRYHCVVTNPPYMSTSSTNTAVQDLLKSRFEVGTGDLFASFIESAFRLSVDRSQIAMITQQSWMFQSSFFDLRRFMVTSAHFNSIVHLGSGAFRFLSGEVVQTVVWSLSPSSGSSENSNRFIVKRLVDVAGWAEKQAKFHVKRLNFTVSLSAFRKVPLNIVGYWLSEKAIEAFSSRPCLGDQANFIAGLSTGDNERFERFWFEVGRKSIGMGLKAREEARQSGLRWFPCDSGGGNRRWYGLNMVVVDWRNDGKSLRDFRHINGRQRSALRNAEYYFLPAITYSKIGTGRPGFRYREAGALFDDTGRRVVTEPHVGYLSLLSVLNSSLAYHYLLALTPTLSFTSRELSSLPSPDLKTLQDNSMVRTAVSISKAEWDTREMSWDFARSPLLSDYEVKPLTSRIDENLTEFMWPTIVGRECMLGASYTSYTRYWKNQIIELASIESENNQFFIDLFGLRDTLKSVVPISEVTILDAELDTRSRENGQLIFNKPEIMKQFVSYGVGCVFGRYSLDKDGLILADAGDDLDAYLAQISEPTLRPAESGILPVTDDSDFADDLPSQWRTFLRTAFGDEHYEENLRFLEDGLGKQLRPYFLKGFYDDHVKRYKKRPIYWLITSPKGTLQALIYLHRYNRDTVNRFLNDYLRPYQQKLEAKRVSAEHVLTGSGSSQTEKTKAQKRIDEIRKALEELSTWERDVVRPLAEKRIELDLDDGVKVNYGKLGAILAKVKGLSA